MEDAFSDDQKRAIDFIKDQDRDAFLTGPAGTGKSYLVEQIRDLEPNSVVTATTGVAAQLIRGRTLHSFLSIHPNHGVIKSRAADARVQECELLILDEISMASKKLFDQMLTRFDYAGHRPRILAVGDFLQLPPVEGEPVFRHKEWLKFQKLLLHVNHRQGQSDFVLALADLRVGKMTPLLSDIIRNRRVPELPNDCTKLYPYRSDVDRINEEKLAELPGRPKCFKWSLTPAFETDALGRVVQRKIQISELKRPRLLEYLYLKVDARVILLNNNFPLWVNGSTGRVTYIDDFCVKVDLDRGGEVTVNKIEEEVFDGNGKVAFRVSQFPMQLGWALTIHKSQGMTLDRVGVSLSNHFATGQTYVAISRCRTKEGLFVVGKMTNLSVDKEALSISDELEIPVQANPQ